MIWEDLVTFVWLSLSQAISTLLRYFVFVSLIRRRRFGTFQLDSAEQLDVSRLERDRVVRLMDGLSTVQQRSYTDPHRSHYPVIRSKAAEPPSDRSKEAEMKNFKINGRSEYQAAYDRGNGPCVFSWLGWTARFRSTFRGVVERASVKKKKKLSSK